MVISSFISSILILVLGLWAYMRLEHSMNLFAERQLLIEPSKFSFKMWKDMPVSMYQSFTFFNLTNWAQVKSIGQKPRFVEVGPYVYKTIWSKSDVNFFDDDKQVSFSEKKQWHFQAHLSRGSEDDLIWTINTPLMTALILIQNAPVITRNIVSLILDGLGEGAFIKRPIRSLLFEGYSDLIVSVGPLFDRRFANFNGKFAYLYNKNDTTDGHWTVSTGQEDVGELNKISRFQSSIVNMSSQASGQPPQGLNEVKPECAQAWSLDQSTNGQLFAPFNKDVELLRLQQQLKEIKAKQTRASEQQASSASQRSAEQQVAASRPSIESSIVQAPKRFFSRISGSAAAAISERSASQNHHPTGQSATNALSQQHEHYLIQQQQLGLQEKLAHLRDLSKFIFYPDLCRPLHLMPSKTPVISENGLEASRYFIDPRVFMNSSQVQSNKCFEMNPRPALANALAATINSVTGANVNVPNLVPSSSSPFALFIPPNHNNNNNNNNNHHHHHHHQMPFSLFQNNHHQNEPAQLGSGLFERTSSSPAGSFLNNALQSLSASANQAADQLAASASNQNNQNSGRLGRVRQLFSNIVSQRMSGASPLLPSLSAGPAALLLGNQNNHQQHHHHHLNNPFAPVLAGLQARNGDLVPNNNLLLNNPLNHRPQSIEQPLTGTTNISTDTTTTDQSVIAQPQPPVLGQQRPQQQQQQQQLLAGGSDRWITQFRFKWPRGVFSIGQCQLGAPIYVSLPHFLDADEYYLEQVDGLKPNRSLHEFYIDVESTLHSIPVGAKARLQLNVATPELRFRNIPNAMIPVLWQEVTFKIDKPVATLLYWSFTMSSTIYTTISVLLILAGLMLLILSLVSTLRRHRLSNRISDAVLSSNSDQLSCSGSSRRVSSSGSSSDFSRTCSSPALSKRRTQQQTLAAEGQRSSWQHLLMANAKRIQIGHHQQVQLDDEDEEHHSRRAATNRAFSCSELALNSLQEDCHNMPRPTRSPRQAGDWPMRDWSRASSHCELVSSYGAHANGPHHHHHHLYDDHSLTTGPDTCMLTCIKHSQRACQTSGKACPISTCGALIGTIVRKQQHQTTASLQNHPHLESLTTTTSDIDTKTTLSSARSGSSNSVGSCSSIIRKTRDNSTFQKSSRATR